VRCRDLFIHFCAISFAGLPRDACDRLLQAMHECRIGACLVSERRGVPSLEEPGLCRVEGSCQNRFCASIRRRGRTRARRARETPLSRSLDDGARLPASTSRRRSPTRSDPPWPTSRLNLAEVGEALRRATEVFHDLIDQFEHVVGRQLGAVPGGFTPELRLVRSREDKKRDRAVAVA
jgi:hypothetical protein